jgi:peptidoglycan-N-acetylmuramic acid deacetylase
LGSDGNKVIYLTFDEGYEAGYTQQILNILKENQVTATFFITAHYVNTQPELVQQMIDEGHIIGNHTVNHKSMPDLTEEQIKTEVMDLHQVIYEKFGYEMKYIRPPKGEFSENTLQVTKQLGYTTVMWSFAYEDWNENKQPDEATAKKKILDNLHDGEIMLLHGNSKTNTNILDSIIKEAKSMGYEFKSLDEFNK